MNKEQDVRKLYEENEMLSNIEMKEMGIKDTEEYIFDANVLSENVMDITPKSHNIEDYCAHSYLCKDSDTLKQGYGYIPDLIYDGDLSKLPDEKLLESLPKKDAIKYAFYYGTLSKKVIKEAKNSADLNTAYEVSRKFIVRSAQASDEYCNLARNALYLMLNGYIEAKTKQYCKTFSPVWQVEEGVNEVWVQIYNGKALKGDDDFLKKLDCLAVSTLLCGYMESWLRDLDARNSESRTRYTVEKDAAVKEIRDLFKNINHRYPTPKEIYHYVKDVNAYKELTHKNKACRRMSLLQVVESLERISVFNISDTVRLNDDIATDDGELPLVEGLQQSSFDGPEEAYIKQERNELVHKALDNLSDTERAVFLAYHGYVYVDGVLHDPIKNISNSNTDGEKRAAKVLGINRGRELTDLIKKADRHFRAYFELRDPASRKSGRLYSTGAKNESLIHFDLLADDEWNAICRDIADFTPDD